VISAKYLHNQKKISDHSPLLVEYKLWKNYL
jgi:endonuclease/exonuclease/phosphatase (EEP) superfamily protein YafD